MEYTTYHITEYLGDRLTGDEKAAFEKELENNTALQNDVALCRQLMEIESYETINAAKIAAFKNVITPVHNTYFGTTYAKKQKPVAKMVTMRKWVLAAAAVFAIALLGIQFFKTQDMLSRYGNLDIVEATERGDNNDILPQLTHELKDKNYTGALPLAKKYINADTSNITAQLYYGTALLHNKQYADSRYWLEKVAATQSLYVPKACLLIALSYYQEKNMDSCKNWIEKIPSGTVEAEQGKLLQKKTDK